MKGATAEPDVKTIKLPRSTRHKIIGKSQNFFRSFMKDQSSNKNSPIVITSWLLKADRNHKELSAAKPQPKGRRDFTAETRSSQSSESILTKKLFTLRPPRLRGESSDNLRGVRKFLEPKTLTLFIAPSRQERKVRNRIFSWRPLRLCARNSDLVAASPRWVLCGEYLFTGNPEERDVKVEIQNATPLAFFDAL